MKDFDQGRKARKKTREERTFVLHGETFVARNALHPDVLSEYDGIDENDNASVILATIDNMIVEMIEPDDDAAVRYTAIRVDREDPVTLEDLMDLVKWVIEVQTGRPTGQPGASLPGPTSIVMPSTEGFSSPGVPMASTT